MVDIEKNRWQVHADLPITLVFGMATSAAALAQMLPGEAQNMLSTRTFRLAQVFVQSA